MPFLYTDTTLSRPSIPEGFDRGRNLSVLETPRPDYDPLGILAGSFMVFPRLEAGIGATNNAFLTNGGRTASAFASLDPSVRVISDWSRHKLEIDGGSDIERYFSASRRDQTAWNVSGKGRLDIGEDFTLTGEADGARQYESPYSGGVQSNLAVLSNFTTSYLSAMGEYKSGQTRAEIAVDRTGYDFSRINLGSGLFIDQTDRNRVSTRVSGQVEYAFTPSVSIYGQAAYNKIDYDHLLQDGTANRDSTGFTVIGGTNFDLSGLLRGSIGLGYMHRSFDSPLYRDINGISAEAQIEYFPTDLTTITLRLRRFLEDSSISSNRPFFDNQASLRLDHELLANLLLNGEATYGRADYIGDSSHRSFYQIGGGAKYMLSRSIAIRGNLSYGTQTVSDPLLGQNLSEVRGVIGVVLQR